MDEVFEQQYHFYEDKETTLSTKSTRRFPDISQHIGQVTVSTLENIYAAIIP